MGLEKFAESLKASTARIENSAIQHRLKNLYEAGYYGKPATAAVEDDRFEAIKFGMIDIIEQAWYPVYHLAHILDSTQGIKIASGGYEGADPREYGNNMFFEVSKGDYTEAVIYNAGKVELHFNPTKDQPFSFGFYPEDTEALKTFQHLLDKLNIKFKLSELQPASAAGTDTTKPFQSHNPAHIPVLEGRMSATDYAKLDIGWEPAKPIDPEEEGAKYVMPGIDENFENLVKETGVGFRHKFILKDLTHNGWYISGRLYVSSVAILPEDFFHYLNGTLGTTARAPKFPYTMARDFSRLSVKGYAQMIDWDNLEITTPTKIKQRLDRYTAGIEGFQPRVNKRGWAVSPNGGFFKPSGIKGNLPQRHGEGLIERQERLDQVLAEISTITRTGNLQDPTVSERLMELQKQVLKIEQEYEGRIMVVDWINDKIMRITSEGKEVIDDMIGTRGLDAVTEMEWLHRSITDTRLRNTLNTLTKKVDDYRFEKFEKERKADPNRRYEMYSGKRYELNSALLELITLGGPIKRIEDDGTIRGGLPVKCLAGVGLDETLADSGLRELDQVKIRAHCQTIAEGFREAWGDVDNFFGDFGEMNTAGAYGYFTETLGSLNDTTYEEIRQEARATTAKTTTSRPVAGMTIPNIEIRPGEFEALMPHQADTFSIMLNHPKHALIDISAGGGKTTIGIVDIIKTIEDVGIQRPLVITAGNLVPQFISEINSLTNGKMNAVPLRAETVTQAVADMNMKSVSDFIRWIKSFPPNTIFVNAYTDYTSRRVFFEDFDMPIAYGTVSQKHSQFRQIMAAIGFQYVMVDESQFIKNSTSGRTLGVSYMLSRAEYTRPASGTMLNNTVMDLYGQVRASINGAVFGTIEDFENEHAAAIMVGNGQDSSAAAQALRKKLRKYAAVITKRKSDWAFLMPDIQPDFVYCQMTATQTEYYNTLMTAAELEIRRELERIKADSEGDDVEVIEARIQSMLQHRLQIVEQFLVAPDLNKDYTDPEPSADGTTPPRPSGADLISPEVLAADTRIDLHFGQGRTDKIIVFGYHKAASAHFMRHSRHANQAIRYTAGNLDVLRKFKEDPAIKILIADMTSMKQGHNLQVAGRVIMLQSLWAPGDYEQAISRMYRPDPRGVYNREYVNLDWVMPQTVSGNATLAIAKGARMISKAIANAQVSNADDHKWMRLAQDFEDLPLLSMDLGLVFDFRMEDANTYFRGWNKLNDYEAGQMKDVRKRVGEKLEAEHNVKLLDEQGRVLDVREFLKYAMVDVTPGQDLKGSRRVYVPWIENAEPADPYNLGLELVGESAVEVGRFVMTEFGPGQVKALRYNKKGEVSSLRVQTAVGVQNIPTNTVAYTTEEKGNKELKRMFANLNKYALIPPGMKADPRLISPTVGKKMEDEEQEKPRIVVKAPNKRLAAPVTEPEPQDEGETEGLNGFGGTVTEIGLKAGIINGMPMLYTKDDVEWMNEISPDWGWVDDFASVEFSTWKAASDFLDKLSEKFWINQAHFNRLRAGLEDMRRGKSIRADTFPNPTLIKNFFLESRKRLGKSQDGTPIAKPYWLTNGMNVRLAFDLSSHDPAIRQWLVRYGKNVAGVKRITQNTGLWVNFFRTPKEAAQDAKQVVSYLKKMGVSVDIKALNEELKKANETFATLRRNTAAQED